MSGLRALHFVVADAEAVGGAGREVLDQHVGVFDQLPEHLLRLERREIEEQRLLAAVQVTADAGLGRIDLHDLGAELQQEPPARRTGQRHTDVDHLVALEGVLQVRLRTRRQTAIR